MSKIIARLVKWSGEIIEKEIKIEWAQDIADAVAGQYYFYDTRKGFAINGADFVHVDIYKEGELTHGGRKKEVLAEIGKKLS